MGFEVYYVVTLKRTRKKSCCVFQKLGERIVMLIDNTDTENVQTVFC